MNGASTSGPGAGGGMRGASGGPTTAVPRGAAVVAAANGGPTVTSEDSP